MRQAILTSGPVKLIGLLLRGCRVRLLRAVKAILEQDVPAAHRNLVEAEHILLELRGCLRPEAGEVATTLSNLYTRLVDELVIANVQKDAERIEAIAGMVGELVEAWDHVEATPI